MKLEDQASLDLAMAGRLGKVTFFRYSLTLNRSFQGHEEQILSEVFDWIKGTGVEELETVSASYAKGKKILLVTLSFAHNVLANVFINLESQGPGFVKKTELAGTEGLYVFDSSSETAFRSDCVLEEEYQVVSDINLDHQGWFDLVKKSLRSQEVEEVS